MTELRFVPLEEFATTEESGAEPLVEVIGSDNPLRAVIPDGGLVMSYGDGGAGKTTLHIDMSMHFAAGITWCGILRPVRPLRIAWIENEGPRPMMRAKFRAKIAAWQGPPTEGRIAVQDEPWARFTYRDESLRAQLGAELTRLETDLLIVGPLSRIGMQGPGNTDEIREFLALVKKVHDLIERPPALLIVHHENRAGQISGAWDREPDTMIHVQGQGHGRTRIFWQKVRWASDLHATSTQLIWAPGDGFTVETKPEVTDDTIADEILAAALETPGASWSKIRERVTSNATEAARVRDRLIATGQLVNTAARKGYFNLTLPDDPTFTRSEPGTALERLPFHLPDGVADPSRSTVPPFYKERWMERNGSDPSGDDFEGNEP